LVAEVTQPSVAPVDQPSSVIRESEPTATDEFPPPAIYAVDAILVEVTQTVTIAALEKSTRNLHGCPPRDHLHPLSVNRDPALRISIISRCAK
jgi:hypothetical protein